MVMLQMAEKSTKTKRRALLMRAAAEALEDADNGLTAAARHVLRDLLERLAENHLQHVAVANVVHRLNRS